MTERVGPTPAGRRGWIISDGKQGNDVQSRGVFAALGLTFQVKSVNPQGLWRLLAPWGPVSPFEGFGREQSAFRPPWPDFAIATGRLTTPYIRALKRRAGLATYTIILTDPKVSARAADLFWVPNHDARRGANVITTLTAPHAYVERRPGEPLRVLAPALAQLPRPRFAVALGGPNGHYHYTQEAIAHLVSALRSLVALGAGVMITPSRRTPAPVVAQIRELATELGAWLWDGEGDNPYADFLAHADYFIVPADSVNMTGEPCATGRPVYVFNPGGGSPKFARFHRALEQHGATRPLPDRFERFESWDYTPLNSAETIAEEIRRRWTKRQQMLGVRVSTRAR
jgi:mitochondrial fission protein ELM1